MLKQLMRLFLLCLGLLQLRCAFGAELAPPGYRPMPLGVHALIGARVVVRPGQVLESATVIIRNGLIANVGKEVAIPPDARVWDMTDRTIYAGFIDCYVMPEPAHPPTDTEESGRIASSDLTARGMRFFGAPVEKGDKDNHPGYEISKVTPDYRAVRDYSPKGKKTESLREQGFAAGLVVPSHGIVRGTSALVALSEEDPNRVIIQADVFQHIAFETHQPGETAYPGSLMGVIASVRQSFFDAQFYSRDHADFDAHPGARERPEFDPAMEALAPVLTGKQPVVFEPGSALMVDRASRVARELGVQFLLVASGQEWRRPDLVKATGAKFIVPLDFSSPPKLPTTDDWDQVTLDQLRSWDWAPENPALLRQQGLEIALTTYGLNDLKDWRGNLRQALDRGLSEDDALAALTVTPARFCGAEKMMGTIEPGKLANLTVVKGKSYFDADSKLAAVWIDGREYPVAGEEASEDSKSKTDEAKPDEQRSSPSSKEAPEKKSAPTELGTKGGTNEVKETATKTKAGTGSSETDRKKERTRELQKKRVARSPLADRGPVEQPRSILIQGATVWTCGPAGLLEDADVLFVDGKIKAVGRRLPVPAGGAEAAILIDGKGLHVTPGLIDCHSHSAILGDVNETTLPSTAMVRIHDVVNSETDNLNHQLAGGVTTVNLLHGSANPIGGQNCVIKLRDDAGPEDLVFTNAPAGIKFALGENVKQSNWGEKFSSRFPQTRMGVRTFIANRFTAAREYLDNIQASKESGGAKVEPRRNLELEAIGEILQGNRWIHCHAYRQDEMIMLMRLMESFGVRIATFQHVLEGYKIADEIVQHGAGGSTFSDWWAYKFEVYDAIPYNGSLMRERGVVVSFNSDSSDLARRLYLEAAKAVKYGATPEIEALKFVTLNPAKQLRIDRWAGSIEPGKDADLAIWSKSPLDYNTTCLQTWVDGRKYFDRAIDAERVKRRVQERDELLNKLRQLKKGSAGGEDATKPGDGFFRVSLEHQYDGRQRDCLDGDR